MDVYSCTAQEAGNPKSRCCQGLVLSGGTEGEKALCACLPFWGLQAVLRAPGQRSVLLACPLTPPGLCLHLNSARLFLFCL